MTGTKNRLGTLRWSDDRPEVSGYYWFRQGPDRVPEIVCVEANGDSLSVTDLESFWRYMPIEEIVGEWAGPIAEPS